MINREDMLALTRRMTVKRTSMTRIAGGYLDMDGYIDGTFNTGFLKLSPDEKEKNLQIAKVIPFADTNQNLKEYDVSDNTTGASSAVMREDGSAILLANGHGALYVP